MLYCKDNVKGNLPPTELTASTPPRYSRSGLPAGSAVFAV